MRCPSSSGLLRAYRVFLQPTNPVSAPSAWPAAALRPPRGYRLARPIRQPKELRCDGRLRPRSRSLGFFGFDAVFFPQPPRRLDRFLWYGPAPVSKSPLLLPRPPPAYGGLNRLFCRLVRASSGLFCAPSLLILSKRTLFEVFPAYICHAGRMSEHSEFRPAAQRIAGPLPFPDDLFTPPSTHLPRTPPMFCSSLFSFLTPPHSRR